MRKLPATSFYGFLLTSISLLSNPFRLAGYESYEEMDVIPKVSAEAKIQPEKTKPDSAEDGKDLKETSDEESESESEGEGEDGKKKRVKEKIGFRDRKVITTNL